MKRKLVFRRDLILFAVIGVLIILSVLIPKIKDVGEKYAVVTVDGKPCTAKGFRLITK